MLAAILVGALAVYSASFANGLLNWDDPANVTQNLHIRALTWQNARSWFTTPLIGMYSPLVYLSYAIDFRIGGLDPTVYHVTNLVLHLLNVCLVFLLVTRLTRSLWTAGAVTALFAVHPMNVAGVTPISLRSALLSSFFYLAALVAYLRNVTARDGPADHGGRFPWLSLVLFACAALSKSAAVVFPLALVLVDGYRGTALTRRNVLQKIPFFLGALAFGVVTFVFREDTLAMARAPQFPLVDRLFLACHSLVVYGARLFVPVGLSPYYPYPNYQAGHLPLVVYLAPVAVAAVVWLAFRVPALRKPFVFGGGFFLANLLLVLKIVPLGAEWTSDRYVYLPSIGLFFFLAEAWRTVWSAPTEPSGASVSSGAITEFAHDLPRARVAVPRAVVACGLAVFAVALCALAVLAYQRNGDWKDDMAFYGRILDLHPNAAIAWCNRCAARIRDLNDPASAVSDCDNAVRLDHGYADAYFNRATARLMLGDRLGAVRDVSAAIGIDSRRAAYYQLRADIGLALGDYQAAVRDSDRAIALDQDGPQAYLAYSNRGVARISLQNDAGAMQDFNEAARLNPDEPVVYLNRGLLRQRLSDRTGSCADFMKAVELGLDTARTAAQDACR